MWGTPPEPGTAALEPGEYLAYHYTSSDAALESILKEGVKQDTRERRPTEEGAAVWGSFQVPVPGKPFVEFKVRREDMYIGQPMNEEGMAQAVARGSNFTMARVEIPVDRITTWSNERIENARMWQDELADADEAWKRKVLNGAYDGAPGVEKARQVLAKEFGSPGWAEKPSGVDDGVAIKRASAPRVDTDRLQRRADRLRREIDDPNFVYPGARMGFRHRAAELTAIESELVKRGALEPEARRTSVVAALIPLVAACHSAECAPPPVGVGGSMPEGVVGWEQRPELWGKERTAGGYVEHDPIIDPESDLGKYLARQIERRLGASALGTAMWWATGRPYRMFTGSMEGREWLSEQLHEGATGEDALALMNLVHDTFRKGLPEGMKTVPVRRAVDKEVGGDPFAPNNYWHMGTKHEDQGGSGFTSWYLGQGDRGSYDLSPHGAGLRETEDTGARMVWEGDVSVDDVFGQFGDTQMEVIVGRPGALARVLQGKSVHAVSAAIELACRDASCAPPPVGTGGSKPGAEGLVDGRERVVQMVENVRKGDAMALMHARNIMSAREQVLGFHELDGHNPELDAGMKAEWSALAKAVPVEEGFVRRGTPEAAQLLSEVRNVLPAAQVGQFQDVHAESVRALLDGVALYPAEVRAKIEGVALGYTEAEQHVAAFGPHGGGLNGPYASQWTLWLGPKAVRPAVGEARPEGVAASVIATVSGRDRQRLVAAHEMGHVVHSMAGEIAWRESGFYVDTRTDPQVPDVPTTPYGETSKGERVAETFALAARDSFKGLEQSQQGLITSVLDRAGLKPTDLAFAAATEDEYEVQFWGDSFELEPDALRAAGCQSADCAPPPVGTGGSKGGGESKSWPMREEDYESAPGIEVMHAYDRWIKEGDNIRLVRKAQALNERMYELATARSEYTPSMSQAEAYDQAVKDLDAHPEMYNDRYITTRWWASMRRVVSATSKSEHPDPDMTKLLSEMHRVTVDALGGPGATIELGRSFDSGAADVGNNPDKFDWSRPSTESASSGITSWTNSNSQYEDWGEQSVVKTFPVEQVLMREGSIDGEFLVGESVERVQEIVGR